jgi:hypothetical protein
MDRYVISGTKKLFSLVRTKIRLAGEADTFECRPDPLPLVKRLSGVTISTIAESKVYREELLKNASFSDERSVASSVLQCMDIIEGVKYKYEPPQYMSNIDARGMKDIDARAKEEALSVNILLMTRAATGGIDLFVGEDPPAGTLFLSGVPTSVASFLEYAFCSPYLSDGCSLRNIRCVLGRRTLIINAIHHSLGVYGAVLSEER